MAEKKFECAINRALTGMSEKGDHNRVRAEEAVEKDEGVCRNKRGSKYSHSTNHYIENGLNHIELRKSSRSRSSCIEVETKSATREAKKGESQVGKKKVNQWIHDCREADFFSKSSTTRERTEDTKELQPREHLWKGRSKLTPCDLLTPEYIEMQNDKLNKERLEPCIMVIKSEDEDITCLSSMSNMSFSIECLETLQPYSPSISQCNEGKTNSDCILSMRESVLKFSCNETQNSELETEEVTHERTTTNQSSEKCVWSWSSSSEDEKNLKPMKELSNVLREKNYENTFAEIKHTAKGPIKENVDLDNEQLTQSAGSESEIPAKYLSQAVPRRRERKISERRAARNGQSDRKRSVSREESNHTKTSTDKMILINGGEICGNSDRETSKKDYCSSREETLTFSTATKVGNSSIKLDTNTIDSKPDESVPVHLQEPKNNEPQNNRASVQNCTKFDSKHVSNEYLYSGILQQQKLQTKRNTFKDDSMSDTFIENIMHWDFDNDSAISIPHSKTMISHFSRQNVHTYETSARGEHCSEKVNEILLKDDEEKSVSVPCDTLKCQQESDLSYKEEYAAIWVCSTINQIKELAQRQENLTAAVLDLVENPQKEDKSENQQPSKISDTFNVTINVKGAETPRNEKNRKRNKKGGKLTKNKKKILKKRPETSQKSSKFSGVEDKNNYLEHTKGKDTIVCSKINERESTDCNKHSTSASSGKGKIFALNYNESHTKTEGVSVPDMASDLPAHSDTVHTDRFPERQVLLSRKRRKIAYTTTPSGLASPVWNGQLQEGKAQPERNVNSPNNMKVVSDGRRLLPENHDENGGHNSIFPGISGQSTRMKKHSENSEENMKQLLKNTPHGNIKSCWRQRLSPEPKIQSKDAFHWNSAQYEAFSHEQNQNRSSNFKEAQKQQTPVQKVQTRQTQNQKIQIEWNQDTNVFHKPTAYKELNQEQPPEIGTNFGQTKEKFSSRRVEREKISIKINDNPKREDVQQCIANREVEMEQTSMKKFKNEVIQDKLTQREQIPIIGNRIISTPSTEVHRKVQTEQYSGRDRTVKEYKNSRTDKEKPVFKQSEQTSNRHVQIDPIPMIETLVESNANREAQEPIDLVASKEDEKQLAPNSSIPSEISNGENLFEIPIQCTQNGEDQNISIPNINNQNEEYESTPHQTAQNLPKIKNQGNVKIKHESKLVPESVETDANHTTWENKPKRRMHHNRKKKNDKPLHILVMTCTISAIALIFHTTKSGHIEGGIAKTTLTAAAVVSGVAFGAILTKTFFK